MMKWPRRGLVLLVQAYQASVSRMMPPSCRFAPSCSAYAITSIEKYGILRGGWLSLRRIARCHPWNPGGHDPVP